MLLISRGSNLHTKNNILYIKGSVCHVLKNMNVRQQLYKKYRLEGYSAYAAARKSGYSHNTSINAKKNIEKRLDFGVLLEIAGLTDCALSEHAKDGLNATKVISANITYGEADSKTNDFIEVPDWNVRHKYYETILKLQRKVEERALIDQSKHSHFVLEWKSDNGKPKDLSLLRENVTA